KTEYPALNGGKNAGTYTRIATEANGKVLAFVREKNGQKIYFIGNLSGQPVTSIVELSGTFKDLLKGDEFTLNQQEAMTFEPWQYYVLK
ncbi:MAG: alpha-amlyase, partial [Flavobacteriia bacterium]